VEYYESEESEEPTIQQHSVIQVTAKYLKKLKETAELVIGKSVMGCVISIPAHYSEKQKKALLEAAHVAGFSSAYSLHEPVAAVMAFNASVVKENNILDKQVLVLDLGAEAFNVSLISNHDGIYTIEESVEEENLGGQRFDEVLMEFAMDDFKKKSKIDISNNKRALFKLRKACETAKRALTRQDTAPCYVESLAEGIDYNGTILRGRFDILSEPLYTRCKHVVLSTLKNAHLTPKDIDQVLLVGGSSRLPRFQEAMKSLFPDIGNEFRTEVEPDEAIALGCAVQAGILIEEGVDLDVEFPEDAINAKHLSKTIGITSLDDEFVPVIPAGTPLPVRRSLTVPLTAGQSSVYLAISEIDEHQKTLVGEVALVDIPAVKNANVEVVFLIELDHLLNVTIKELVSGKSVNAILK
jgi:L1 cell adhesion molecule like protein